MVNFHPGKIKLGSLMRCRFGFHNQYHCSRPQSPSLMSDKLSSHLTTHIAGVAVSAGVEFGSGIFVPVAVGVSVGTGVLVAVEVNVGAVVGVPVAVGVGVAVSVGVCVADGVGEPGNGVGSGSSG